MESESEMGYQIADETHQKRAGARRSMAFPEGISSYTKIATPDPIETNAMKVAGMEQPIGIKVASPENRGDKIANPSMVSLTGDFRRPIRVSGGDPVARQKVGMKLYANSVNPTLKVRR